MCGQPPQRFATEPAKTHHYSRYTTTCTGPVFNTQEARYITEVHLAVTLSIAPEPARTTTPITSPTGITQVEIVKPIPTTSRWGVHQYCTLCNSIVSILALVLAFPWRITWVQLKTRGGIENTKTDGGDDKANPEASQASTNSEPDTPTEHATKKRVQTLLNPIWLLPRRLPRAHNRLLRFRRINGWWRFARKLLLEKGPDMFPVVFIQRCMYFHTFCVIKSSSCFPFFFMVSITDLIPITVTQSKAWESGGDQDPVKQPFPLWRQAPTTGLVFVNTILAQNSSNPTFSFSTSP